MCNCFTLHLHAFGYKHSLIVGWQKYNLLKSNNDHCGSFQKRPSYSWCGGMRLGQWVQHRIAPNWVSLEFRREWQTHMPKYIYSEFERLLHYIYKDFLQEGSSYICFDSCKFWFLLLSNISGSTKGAFILSSLRISADVGGHKLFQLAQRCPQTSADAQRR